MPQPSPERAKLDVGALPASDSAFGCRQMIGNAWEWTDNLFGPYPRVHPGCVPG